MALDAGSGGGRCFICDTEGKKIVSAYQEWNRDTWNPAIGWQIFSEVIRDALAQGKISPENIVGISSTSMREEIVLLNEKGRGIKFELDTSSISHGQNFAEQYGEQIYLKSGHWPTPGFMAVTKLVWLRDHKPEVLKKTRFLQMINDWILYKLTDNPTTESSGACETCLFDISTNDWAWELIDELQLPSNIFPPVHENGEVIGGVTSEVAKRTGLKKGTPVIVGGADTQCGLIGTASVQPQQTTAVAGTTTPVQMTLSEPVFDPLWRTWTNCHAVPGQWILESNAGSTGWIYRWFRDNFARLEMLMAHDIGMTAYELINQVVEHSPRGAGGLYAFLGSGIMNVRHMSTTGTRGPSALLGVRARPGPSAAGKKELARAIIENTCYAVRGNCEQIEEISHKKIKELRFCGGSARSKIWTQIQADVLGIPVMVPKEKDATSVGAAILASVGAEIFDRIDQAAKAMVHWETRVNPQNHSEYDILYKEWRTHYDKLSKYS